MLYVLEFMIILLWSFAAAKQRAKDGDPCRDYKGGLPYRFPDPYNCKKYWMCIYGHSSGKHFTCPATTSFTPNLNGTCDGPPPLEVKGCWKSKGLEEYTKF